MDEFEQLYYEVVNDRDSLEEKIEHLIEVFELVYDKYRDTIPELEELEELLGNLL